MGELVADLFVSVDGYAAGHEVGPFFGLGGPDLERWVGEESGRPQTLLMGRVTYELMAAMSSAGADSDSIRMNELPKAVFSNTLTEPLGWQNTRLLRGDLTTTIGAVKAESEVPIRTIGSLSLVSGLLRLGLVDRLRLMVFPLTLGPDGREPAYAAFPRDGMELIESKVLDSRLVLLSYRPGSAWLRNRTSSH